MRREAVRILCTALVLLSVAAATAVESAYAVGPDDGAVFDDSGPNDPWEGFNRGIFWFNERADIYFLRPVAVGWDFVMPDMFQTAIKNIFANARFPVLFLNNLLQAKPIEAGEDLGRFLLNTTVGIGGIWDPAKEFGIVANNEDFGQTLGYWGVPPGPYLVLPLLGPSSPRGAAGLAVDSAVQPPYPYLIAWYISAAITATDFVNTRARYIEEIDESRETALDFYSFQRNAYVSYRENLVRDREEDDEAPTDDLYYFDDDEEEETDAGGGEGGE
jgi:phospholipid-binding lipoprotein MlaA